MKTVLIGDDDSSILLGTGVRLKSMGYTVYTAKDAVSAVSAVVKNDPDVVVWTSRCLPGTAFWSRTACRIWWCRRQPHHIHHGERESAVARARHEFGRRRFLQKPFDATALADAIESALSPATTGCPRPAVYKSPPVQPKEKFSILLVDDDPTAIRVLSRILGDYTPLRFATCGQVA